MLTRRTVINTNLSIELACHWYIFSKSRSKWFENQKSNVTQAAKPFKLEAEPKDIYPSVAKFLFNFGRISTPYNVICHDDSPLCVDPQESGSIERAPLNISCDIPSELHSSCRPEIDSDLYSLILIKNWFACLFERIRKRMLISI